jgi:hypothetical protein
VIAGYGVVLMYVVKVRKWELGINAENALRLIFVNKRKSKTLKKK